MDRVINKLKMLYTKRKISDPRTNLSDASTIFVIQNLFCFYTLYHHCGTGYCRFLQNRRDRPIVNYTNGIRIPFWFDLCMSVYLYNRTKTVRSILVHFELLREVLEVLNRLSTSPELAWDRPIYYALQNGKWNVIVNVKYLFL